MAQYYKAVCQWCGKIGNREQESPSGGTPNFPPRISGTCPSHPSGNQNLPHAPKWEKA